MFFDPIYFVFVIPGMLLSMWASFRVKSAFNKYSQVRSAKGYSGAEAAQHLLDRAGIHDVRIVPAHGFLSDHYNPVSKELALSEPVFNSTSLAAIGVATHEAGHAIQHAHNYAPLWLRSALVLPANLGSQFGPWIIIIGLAMNSFNLVIGGIILFSLMLLFQVITLPVEFDASSRAKALVVESGIIYPEERPAIASVLNAAALTYVAAAVSSFLTLLYFLFRAGLLGGRRDE